MRALRKFSSQADPELLAGLEDVAKQEGRLLQAVIGDAMREYLTRKRQEAAREDVLQAFQESLRERDQLYRLLAK